MNSAAAVISAAVTTKVKSTGSIDAINDSVTTWTEPMTQECGSYPEIADSLSRHPEISGAKVRLSSILILSYYSTPQKNHVNLPN